MNPSVFNKLTQPATEELTGWQHHVAAARIFWSELTTDELLQTQGHRQELSTLVQDRYRIAQETANKQVHAFMSLINTYPPKTPVTKTSTHRTEMSMNDKQ